MHWGTRFTHLYKLFGEFKGGALKAQVVPGRIGQDETKVNVNQVSLRVQQDVAIVSEENRRKFKLRVSIPVPDHYT